MTDSILLREDLDRGIVRLSLNNPESLNALSDAMLAAMTDELASLAVDTTTKVVILRGIGKVFCAGHDLKEMQAGRQSPDKGVAYFADLFGRCAAVMKSITTLPQPVIASAHGIATAAGCQLVATCDLAVAASDTRFGVNGVNIGLFCSTPMVALTRNVQAKPAFEMLVTGEFIDADRAREIGLINRVAAPDALEYETLLLARTVASKLGSAVRIGKRAFYEQAQLSLNDAYDHTGEVMVENMMLRDTEEGISAFLEKRKPDWHS